MVGIVGYGAYIPRHRIKVEEIAKVWGADAESYKKGLALREKSVPTPDQDTITMSVEAARKALARAGIAGSKIGAVYVGSESHPYAVKPSGTVLAEAIGATPDVHCADFEFACKASRSGPIRRRARPETPSSTRHRQALPLSSSARRICWPSSTLPTPT
jgi:hydroxymethylglutaryl-CoA synthase